MENNGYEPWSRSDAGGKAESHGELPSEVGDFARQFAFHGGLATNSPLWTELVHTGSRWP